MPSGQGDAAKAQKTATGLVEKCQAAVGAGGEDEVAGRLQNSDQKFPLSPGRGLAPHEQVVADHEHQEDGGEDQGQDHEGVDPVDEPIHPVALQLQDILGRCLGFVPQRRSLAKGFKEAGMHDAHGQGSVGRQTRDAGGKPLPHVHQGRRHGRMKGRSLDQIIENKRVAHGHDLSVDIVSTVLEARDGFGFGVRHGQGRGRGHLAQAVRDQIEIFELAEQSRRQGALQGAQHHADVDTRNENHGQQGKNDAPPEGLRADPSDHGATSPGSSPCSS